MPEMKLHENNSPALPSQAGRKEGYAMSKYCTNCGAEMGDSVNYCPQCGTPADGYAGASENSGLSDAARTAAVVGGTVLGVSALNNLARQMAHRRRPPYYGPMGGPGPGWRGGPGPGRPGGPGGPGHGPGGPGHGPGGPGRGGPGGPGRGGGRW